MSQEHQKTKRPVVTIAAPSDFNAGEWVPLLAENKEAAVQISSIYSKDDILEMVQNIKNQGVSWYIGFDYKQGRIGICATEYYSKPNGKAIYFSLERESSRVRNVMFPDSLDPVGKIMSLFSGYYPIAVATEPDINNSKYFAGLVRAMQYESTIHFDFAQRQLSGWAIAKCETQLAVVIYLQLPQEGGELIIYDKLWDEQDDVFNKDN